MKGTVLHALKYSSRTETSTFLVVDASDSHGVAVRTATALRTVAVLGEDIVGDRVLCGGDKPVCREGADAVERAAQRREYL